MAKDSKIAKLTDMVGKHWKDKNTDDVFKLLSYKQDGDQIMIATDKEWINVTVFELNIFFQNHLPVQISKTNEVTIIQQPATMKTVEISTMPNTTMKKLADTLLDNIEKVKVDKEYIPQAKMISDTVNSLIGLAKVEIDLRTKI